MYAIASNPEIRIFQFLYLETSNNVLDVWKTLTAFMPSWKQLNLVLINLLFFFFLI